MRTKPYLPLVAALIFASVPLALAGSISTTTINDETVVKWNGKQVFKGTVDGPVISKCSSVDGKEVAAIFSGDTVVWESEPGAAAAIKIEAVAPAFKVPPAKEGDKGIKVTSVDGESVVAYKGKVVWKGKTEKGVDAKETTEDGETNAAAFDGKKVLWENVPGAAKKVWKSVRKPETV